jgi:hypothetical protein
MRLMRLTCSRCGYTRGGLSELWVGEAVGAEEAEDHSGGCRGVWVSIPRLPLTGPDQYREEER